MFSVSLLLCRQLPEWSAVLCNGRAATLWTLLYGTLFYRLLRKTSNSSNRLCIILERFFKSCKTVLEILTSCYINSSIRPHHILAQCKEHWVCQLSPKSAPSCGGPDSHLLHSFLCLHEFTSIMASKLVHLFSQGSRLWPTDTQIEHTACVM